MSAPAWSPFPFTHEMKASQSPGMSPRRRTVEIETMVFPPLS